MNKTIPKKVRQAGTYIIDGSALPAERLLSITGNLDTVEQSDPAFTLTVTMRGSLDGGNIWDDLSIYHWTGGLVPVSKTDPLGPMKPAPCGFEITIPAAYRNAAVAAFLELPQAMTLGATVTTV